MRRLECKAQIRCLHSDVIGEGGWLNYGPNTHASLNDQVKRLNSILKRRHLNIYPGMRNQNIWPLITPYKGSIIFSPGYPLGAFFQKYSIVKFLFWTLKSVPEHISRPPNFAPLIRESTELNRIKPNYFVNIVLATLSF